MFMGSYRLKGDPTELAAAYDRLMNSFPADEFLIHVCVKVDDGLVIYDSCPSQDEFHEFSTSPAFRAALHEAGLPIPEVCEIGEVHNALAPALIDG
jgi:hypothetical protein